MRALLQRVRSASVVVDGSKISLIGYGLLILLGLHEEDSKEDADRMIKKILSARIFGNGEGSFSKSVKDIAGDLLVVSQITLYGDMTKGNRPDFSKSMKPAQAEKLYSDFLQMLRDGSGLRVEQGRFGARMEIELVNTGPVTFLIDSKG